MSTSKTYTVSEFFDLRGRSSAWVSQVANSRAYAPVKQRLAQEMKGFPTPPGFDALVIRQLGDLLNFKMSDVVVGAWRKRQEIVQYRDREKYPADEVHVVPLLEHTLTSTHSPTIQPIVNNVALPKITFDVVVRLKIEGMMLKIRAAKIRELLVGSCTGNGAVEYAGFPIVSRDTAPYTFPASVVFKEGVAI